MMRVLPATSNAQRQREFRAAHPGYFRKYRARHKTLTRSEQNAQYMALLAANEAKMAAAQARAGTGEGEAGKTDGVTPNGPIAP